MDIYRSVISCQYQYFAYSTVVKKNKKKTLDKAYELFMNKRKKSNQHFALNF